MYFFFFNYQMHQICCQLLCSFISASLIIKARLILERHNTKTYQANLTVWKTGCSSSKKFPSSLVKLSISKSWWSSLNPLKASNSELRCCFQVHLSAGPPYRDLTEIYQEPYKNCDENSRSPGSPGRADPTRERGDVLCVRWDSTAGLSEREGGRSQQLMIVQITSFKTRWLYQTATHWH